MAGIYGLGLNYPELDEAFGMLGGSRDSRDIIEMYQRELIDQRDHIDIRERSETAERYQRDIRETADTAERS